MTAKINIMSDVCPKFDGQQETILEFLQRFKVQNSDALTKAGDNEKKKAAVLIRALPIAIVTDLQRRIAPTDLVDATYTVIEEKLKGQFEVKKSIVAID